MRLADERTRVGVANQEDVYVARATVGTYQDTLRQLELSREQAIRSLEILLGRYPAAAAEVASRLPGFPGEVPTGLPSELLERRPDVVAAERRIAAAFNRIGEAKAARLPKISLTTGVSAISSELFVLQDHDNPVWSVGANLLAPLFTGGALKTQVEIRTAEQKQALAEYAAVGLRAFGEVENALAAEFAARQRERILTAVLSDSQQALGVVQTQFKVGSTDLRFVEQRQLALNATLSSLIHMQAEQRMQRVNLHLALGGSFEPRPEAPAPGGARRTAAAAPAMTTAAPAAGSGLLSPAPPDFSLVLGGPLYQLLRGTRLTGDTLQLLHRRIIVAGDAGLGCRCCCCRPRKDTPGAATADCRSSATWNCTSGC